MKIFISWSGKRSHSIAELLRDWIKCVIQASRPWLSTRDIDRGALWFNEINDQLREISVGIICITQENKNRSWLLFEAGALAKGLTSNRVCTLLIDLKSSDLEDPLAQFNHTFPERESMLSLVKTLNGCLNENAIDDRILEKIFDTYWPQFEDQFKQRIEANASQSKPEPKSTNHLLAEILDNTRSLGARIRRLEQSYENLPREAVSNSEIAYRNSLELARRRVVELSANGAPMDVIINALRDGNISDSNIANLVRDLETRQGVKK